MEDQGNCVWQEKQSEGLQVKHKHYGQIDEFMIRGTWNIY